MPRRVLCWVCFWLLWLAASWPVWGSTTGEVQWAVAWEIFADQLTTLSWLQPTWQQHVQDIAELEASLQACQEFSRAEIKSSRQELARSRSETDSLRSENESLRASVSEATTQFDGSTTELDQSLTASGSLSDSLGRAQDSADNLDQGVPGGVVVVIGVVAFVLGVAGGVVIALAIGG